MLTGFSQFSPLDGIPAADSTQVLIWYSPTAMYVGIRAFEAHGAVHATLADRDKISADDNVQFLLGTFQRPAPGVSCSPSIRSACRWTARSSRPGANDRRLGRRRFSGRAAPDLSQDFVFTSKGRLTEYGYEVEIRIPFKSLKYQSADVQSWDFNVVRQVQHSGYEDSLGAGEALQRVVPRAVRARSKGSRGFDRGLVLDLNPVVTRKAHGRAECRTAGATRIRGRSSAATCAGG